jgi:5'-nucleotidase
MAGEPKSLAKSRVLISNDDGVHAPGLKLLERVARKLAKEVWVVAPETEQSAASHSLTLRRPLRVRKLSAKRFGVDGTPTDSVLLGVNEVMKDHAPDLVLSGINRGGNVGEDVTYSGTVAAAMEATLLGFRAIAFSQLCEESKSIHWATAERFAEDILKRLAPVSWAPNVLINVNFPDCAPDQVTGIEVVRMGKRKIGGQLAHGTDPRGERYFWIGPQRSEDRLRVGTDMEAVTRKAIAVTPLELDLTHTATFKRLKRAFA